MPFPKTPRSIYTHRPLAEVICQLRFPPILRIDTTIPDIFQEKVRSKYPFYQKRLVENILPIELQEILPQEIVHALTTKARSEIHDFQSAEKNWQLSLAKDFIALATRQYKRWSEFREYLTLPLDLLSEEYAPVFYIRLGLRYRNIIRRSQLGLVGVPWTELLEPYIAAPLSNSHMNENEVLDMAHRIDVALEKGNTQVRIVHGFTQLEGETCYLIDSDIFSEERTEVQDAIGKLDYFNGQAGRIFRWCITNRLHDALGPTDP